MRTVVGGLFCCLCAFGHTASAQTTRGMGNAGAQEIAGTEASAQSAPLVPAFALRSLRGDTIRFGTGAQPTLVAVFASWCRSCRAEVATFNRLQRELAPLGVRVVALSADDGSDERLRTWLARSGAQYPVVRDTSRVALRALGVVGVPEAYLIGGNGRVSWSRRGPIESGLPALRRALGTRQKPAGNPARY